MDKIEAVKLVRKRTGLGIFDVKKALEACDWDVDKSFKYIKENAKPCDKPVGAGGVFSYVHHNKKMGALVELHCATDFVAMCADFQQLGHTLAMHITAMAPTDLKNLLDQESLTEKMTIRDLLKLTSATFNEPIVVSRFTRFVLESPQSECECNEV